MYNEVSPDKPPKGQLSLRDRLMKNDFPVLLAVLALAAIAFIYAGKGGVLPAGTQAKVADLGKSSPSESGTRLSNLEKELETKLQNNLQQMQGVGRVQVSVSLASGLKNDYARNNNVTKRTSKEQDKAGGVRETTEVTENNQLVIPNGASQPVIVMEEKPEIAGVLVIAEGASDPKVKEGIHVAVRTLLNIPAGKVIVEPMGGR